MSAVLLDGLLARSASKKSGIWRSKEKLLAALRSCRAVDADFCTHICESTAAALGGTLLSAAEIESSKYYIQADDGWKLLYQVGPRAHLVPLAAFVTEPSLIHSFIHYARMQWPVADGVLLSGDVGFEVQWDESSPLFSNVETLGVRNIRVWKDLVGPMEVGKVSAACVHRSCASVEFSSITATVMCFRIISNRRRLCPSR